MSIQLRIPIYKTAPFLRLLLPFIAGIILQWYAQVYLPVIVLALFGCIAANTLFYFLPLSFRYKLQSLQGFLINALVLVFGLLITWQKDARHSNDWYGNHYKDSGYIIARIEEPLIEKPKSYKASAVVESLINHDSTTSCEGKLLLYFSKDSIAAQLKYGDRILLNKALQPIKNSGNPGAFNYERYAAFLQIFHNAFLKEKDWVLLPDKKINGFKQFIFSGREHILNNLRNNINSGKDELGIAEALLIGYTNDLDKDIVQAYSNTGVVHIIAISGMHLGLIYVLLVWLFARIPLVKRSKLLQVILILSCLWLFSLLTGASASVLRSAVMFTFITVGNNLGKKSSIYNSLAASAFVLLCYDPYFLWDVGFQLSYLAVVGIIVFQKPIYNLCYIKNKWVDNIWKLMAISLAAQILTFPICIYYFHQFPNLFLITNIIAVPLSSIILYAEIFLVAFSWLPFVGEYAGKLTGWLVWLMNKIILTVNNFSFAVWNNIPANILSTWLLYAVVIGISAWLISKHISLLRFSLFALLTFVMQYDYENWVVKNQKKIIVYNVPKSQAIDIVHARDYLFIGDSALRQTGVLQNFHLKPARVAMQLNHQVDSAKAVFLQPPFYQFGNKRIVVIDNSLIFEPLRQKITVDIIVISKNVKLYIPQLARVFNCSQYVADASNSLWKIAKWKKDCEQLHLHLHSVPEQGAFIVDL
jgi:competence protein ComEC